MKFLAYTVVGVALIYLAGTATKLAAAQSVPGNLPAAWTRGEAGRRLEAFRREESEARDRIRRAKTRKSG